MVKVSRAHGFVPSRGLPQACTRTTLSRPFRHRFGPSKLPRLYVPISPSPVSRQAGRDLRRSIGPSTIVVFKLWTSSSVLENTIADLIFMFRAKRPLYLWHSDMNETANTGVSEERGRMKTAKLHTSGAKRAETWWGGVKWWDLAIGLAVASGG